MKWIVAMCHLIQRLITGDPTADDQEQIAALHAEQQRLAFETGQIEEFQELREEVQARAAMREDYDEWREAP